MTYPYCTCCGNDLSHVGQPDEPGSNLYVLIRSVTATRFTRDITEPINFGIDAEYFYCSATCWEKSKSRLLDHVLRFVPLPEELAKRRIISCSCCGEELDRSSVHISYDLLIGKNAGVGDSMEVDVEACVELGRVCLKCEDPMLRTDKRHGPYVPEHTLPAFLRRQLYPKPNQFPSTEPITD